MCDCAYEIIHKRLYIYIYIIYIYIYILYIYIYISFMCLFILSPFTHAYTLIHSKYLEINVQESLLPYFTNLL